MVINNIQIFVYEDKSEMSNGALEFLIDKIREKPNIVLGGATGSTPVIFYEGLRNRIENDKIDLFDVKMVFLDEYFSRVNYHNYTRKHLQPGKTPKSVKEKNIFIPRVCFYDEYDKLVSSTELEEILKDNPSDFVERGPEISIKDFVNNPVLMSIKESCEKYEKIIDDLVINYQILGIGVEGHIGFNERGTSENSLTHLTRLAESTIKSNSGDFLDGVSAYFAVTQGIKTIAKSKNRMLLASGKSKQDAIYDLIYGEISPNNPSTYLRNMGNTFIFLDKEASAKLDLDEIKLRNILIKS